MSALRIELHHPSEHAEHPAQPSHSGPPPPEPEPALAVVTWRGGQVKVEADDPTIAATLRRTFRPTPVVVDDPSLRYPGTRGELVLQPGDLAWFRAVAQVRVPAETGLIPRFVPGVTEGGYDPAAGYRRFQEQVERLDTRSAD